LQNRSKQNSKRFHFFSSRAVLEEPTQDGFTLDAEDFTAGGLRIPATL
jgi:hypothetical protein